MCVLFGLPAFAVKSEQDSLIVSVVTCDPGREIYELCGHEAIRIRGTLGGMPIDSVWNYGEFDFAQPNFVYRFVKGETDYRVGGYPFYWFLPEYRNAGRGVTEQDLNLSQDEAYKMLSMLRENTLPQNRKYRYNYVRNNCATKIVDLIDSVSDKRVIYPDSIHYGTFRKVMRHYHKAYPWYQFGIDLALGSGIDLPINGREEMFVPVEMRRKVDNAKYEDGVPLMSAKRVLSVDSGYAVDPPTPWYLTPIAVAFALLLVSAIVFVAEVKSKKIFRWIYTLWFGICGLAGCLVLFLVVVSEHEATSPNLLLIWLNPVQLLLAACIWSRRLRILNLAVAWYDIVAIGSLLIVWPMQAQSGNIAFFPLMGVTILLAVAYAMVKPNKINSRYKYNNEKICINGAGRNGGDKRRGSGRQPSRRGAKTRGGNRS